MVKSNYVNLNLSFLEIIRNRFTLRNKDTCRNRNKFDAVAVTTENLNDVDVELKWINGLRDQVRFLNENMLHFSI